MSTKYKSVLKPKTKRKINPKKVTIKEPEPTFIDATLTHPPGNISTPNDLFHVLGSFRQRHLDLMQEIAAQGLGRASTTFYPQMADIPDVPASVHPMALEDIKRVDSLSHLSRALKRETQSSPKGGGFYEAIKWTLDKGRMFGSSLIHQVQMGHTPITNVSSRIKGVLNTLEEMARATDTITSSTFDFAGKVALVKSAKLNFQLPKAPDKARAKLEAKEPRVLAEDLADETDTAVTDQL